MTALLLSVFALFVFAIVLRSQKRLAPIDWKSRIELLILSSCICLILAHWLHSSVLDAAEWAATTGRPRPSMAADIVVHYAPILMPIYIAVTALLIDVISRITRALLHRRVDPASLHASIWRTACANIIVFVLTPGLLYAWAIAFASTGSMISDAAQDGVRPFLVAYAAPTHWLERYTNNEIYRTDTLDRPQSDPTLGWTLRARFETDAAPWFALAVLLGCVARLRNGIDQRKFIEYFLARPSSSPPEFARSLLSTWRGIVVLCFTAAWAISALISQLLLDLVLRLQFIWLPLVAIGVIAAMIGVPVLILNALRNRRKRPPLQ